MKFRELNVGDWFIMDGMAWEKIDFPMYSSSHIMSLDKDNFGHIYPHDNLDAEVGFLPKFEYIHPHFHSTGHNVFNDRVSIQEALAGLPLKSTTKHEVYAKTRVNAYTVYIIVYSEDEERQGLTMVYDDKTQMIVRECLEIHLNHYEDWTL